MRHRGVELQCQVCEHDGIERRRLVVEEVLVLSEACRKHLVAFTSRVDGLESIMTSHRIALHRIRSCEVRWMQLKSKRANLLARIRYLLALQQLGGLELIEHALAHSVRHRVVEWERHNVAVLDASHLVKVLIVGPPVLQLRERECVWRFQEIVMIEIASAIEVDTRSIRTITNTYSHEWISDCKRYE